MAAATNASASNARRHRRRISMSVVAIAKRRLLQPLFDLPAVTGDGSSIASVNTGHVAKI